MLRIERPPRVGLVVLALALFACGEPHTLAPLSASAAKLAECPTSDSATVVSTLGLDGGVVSIGGTSVVIPAGALTSATSIKLRIPASTYVEIDVKANDLQTFTFAQPITVTIDYSRCASGTLLSAPLTVWHIDPSTKELLEDMHGVDDKVTHRITFTTTHFSGYAVAN